MRIARIAALLLLSLCAGCGSSRYATRWDGRRGYDGNGDYGYDLPGSRSAAGAYRAQAARDYPAPGTPDDPWGPYIQRAAARFSVPEQWIREVMRQESGGHEYDADGGLITSSAGAMGLMQIMPGTYDILRQRYALGGDPYEPQDNILAGAAYIREMSDRYGAPAFLAAYNAGPDRLDAYLTGGEPLPEETTNYLASIAPRLGMAVAMTGPLAAYAGGGAADRAYAGGGMTGQQYAQQSQGESQNQGQIAAGADDPSTRAFDGGGLVTADAPTGDLTGTADPPAPPTAVVAVVAAPVAAPPVQFAVQRVAVAPAGSDAWGIQVGAFPSPDTSRAAIAAARARIGTLLARTQPTVTPVQRSGTLYRARFIGLSADSAAAACEQLAEGGMACFAVAPGS